MKYRWTYIDSRGKWYLRSKSYYSFGSSLHRVLERFHDTGDAGVKTIEEVVSAFEENWITAGYSSAEEMAEAFGEGKAILESYVQAAQQRPSTAVPVFTERQFRCDMGIFDLIGRVDRVDEHEDGRYEIVDYKSGRSGVEEDDVKYDLAMMSYQLLLKRKFPEREVFASIVALRTGASASASLTEQELGEFESDLRKLGEEILHADYEQIAPKFKSLCVECDFRPLCKQHPDFAEDESEAKS